MVKARECANGSEQREDIMRKDAASPIVCLDSIFIAGVIEAIENWDVAIIDIPGTFLHADLEDDDQVLMVMEGRFAELMKIHWKFVAKNNNGKKVLYEKLQLYMNH